MIITANMATYPARQNIVEKTIDSIYDQVDILRIFLNEYPEIPEFCKRPRIEPILGENLRSSGKFFSSMNDDEHYFSIDDDLEYPVTYVDDMLELLRIFDDMIVVTLHGKILNDNKKNYFHGRIRNGFSCLHEVVENHFIHVLGGGVSVFNTNNVKIDFRKFKYNYMDDIEVSMQLQKQNIPILLKKHKRDYIKYNMPSTTTLFNDYCNDDDTHTEMLDSLKWEIKKPK